MRLGYADPPYPGMAAKHYLEHADYDGEVDHDLLLHQLVHGYDGWILHTSVPALATLLPQVAAVAADYRVLAWVKTWCAFKANVSPAYAWEPVIVSPLRKPRTPGPEVARDWFACPMTMQRGLVGAKPARLVMWLLEMVGAQPGDEMDDLFPGTGAVSSAWANFCGNYIVPQDTLF